jgi:hypothetical protein
MLSELPCRSTALAVPTPICEPRPISVATIGSIGAVQRAAGVWIGTSGAYNEIVPHSLSNLALYGHSVGQGVAKREKKHRQCCCKDAGDFSHRSASFNQDSQIEYRPR